MIEAVYSYSNIRRIEGLEVTHLDGTITIAKGYLITDGLTQKFDETTFELDTTSHVIYDLYIVQGDDNVFSYHLDKSYIDTGILPSYAGNDKLLHTFLTIEVKDGNIKGYAIYLKPDSIGISEERKPQSTSRRAM